MEFETGFRYAAFIMQTHLEIVHNIENCVYRYKGQTTTYIMQAYILRTLRKVTFQVSQQKAELLQKKLVGLRVRVLFKTK